MGDAKLLATGGSDHDFSSVILKNGRVLVAIEDERVTRVKHGRGICQSLPTHPSLQYCLDYCDTEISAFDHIYSNLHLEERSFEQPLGRVQRISHHLAHAACAFYPSPFEQAAIVVVDGAGNRVTASDGQQELESISIGKGKGQAVDVELVQVGKRRISTCYWRYITSDSIGEFYGLITEAIGFGTFGAGKTMGLAPYGDTSLVEPMREFVGVLAEGRFQFDPYAGIWDWLLDHLKTANNPFQIRANLAAAAQSIFEEAVLNTVRHAHRVTGERYLCYGGGCALNSVANYRILTESPFEDLFIYPAPSDNGTAVGAALYAWHHILGNARQVPPRAEIGSIAYCGKQYSEAEIRQALGDFPVFARQATNVSEEIAWRIAHGEVIGWFQGRSEIGPRALGNRSILADATSPFMRNHVNLSIKGRESFRPLAPVVTREACDRFFQLDRPSPFMLLVAPVRPQYRYQLASITHIDGTARVQTVEEKCNPRLYSLLKAFEKLKGYPVLLNTSFNLRGEPIVESPGDALHCFLNSNIDTLVIEDFVVEKHTPWAAKTQSPEQINALARSAAVG